ncbi:MAG: triosephosphate isomerase [Candidatus Colwellbacteria bacterium]|nr:triosephosphate isomerase [Candidatus Colwellbacteria bacterium]
MPKLIIANWKSNPSDLASAIKLAKAIDHKNVVIAAPFPYLPAVYKAIKKSALGAQDLFWADGPYTGEISAQDLKTLKVKYVIVGHSERRKNLKETDEMINRKLKAALDGGLKAVLCVGESAAIRKKGIKEAKKFVKKQLIADLKSLNSSAKGGSSSGGKFHILNSQLIVAYEPVWAISTEKGSKPDTPEDAVEMIKFIKGILNSSAKGGSSSGGKFHILNSKVLYGGSVTAKNAKAFLGRSEINGALVGSASLKPNEFNKIVKSVIL